MARTITLSIRSIAASAVTVAIIAILTGYYLLKPTGEIPEYNVTDENIAIHGYDTVAYFTEGKPTKGSSEFEHVWEDVRWRFANTTNRELFRANPERYAPRFGGYCAAGVALGEYADVDPEAFSIVDGKLYMISTKENHEGWEEARNGHIYYAEYNWEKNRAAFRDNR